MSSTVKGKHASGRGQNCTKVSRMQPELCVCVWSLPRYLLFYHKQFLEYE